MNRRWISALLLFVPLSLTTSDGYAQEVWLGKPLKYGVEMSFTRFMDSNVPAYYYDLAGPKRRYIADVVVHASWNHLLFELEPMIDGYTQRPWGTPPTQGGMCVGAGTQFGVVTFGPYHCSHHNLDSYSGIPGQSSYNEDGIRLSVRLGDKRDFSLW